MFARRFTGQPPPVLFQDFFVYGRELFPYQIAEGLPVIRPQLANLLNFETWRKFDEGMPSVSVSRVVNDPS